MFQHLADKRIEPMCKIVAPMLYDQMGDAWPVFWSSLNELQKQRIFNAVNNLMWTADPDNLYKGKYVK